MEQLVEIAYELIAFRATFKGELFRHGMGIGKIKLVKGEQLVHILAFTIESGMGEHGKVLAVFIAAKVDTALEIVHKPLGEICKVLTGSRTERKKLIFGIADLFCAGEIDLLHDEGGVLSLGKFRDQTEDMVILFGMAKLIRFGDIGLDLIQVDKVFNCRRSPCTPAGS